MRIIQDARTHTRGERDCFVLKEILIVGSAIIAGKNAPGSR